ncbi:hypothetical protein B0H34DRAFT_469226 [Crassisporium funariophilum]|nr:hypothetical protein B0H34DRAFT_469226 [Crassisporium funariophilum]
MLVDNSLYQPSFFSSASSSAYPEYPTDLSDIFDTELFTNSFAASSSTSSGSRGSTPQNLLTPPQEPLPTSFPDVHDDDTTNNFYALFDEDLKAINDPLSLPSSSNDFMGIDGAYANGGGYGMGMNNYGMGMDLSSLGMSIPPIDDPMQTTGIDPQLVDTPSAISDHDDEPEEQQEALSSPEVEKKEPEKLTFTIAPVKVGGHGKARKGTVQSGGIVKKTALSLANKEKENPISAPPAVKKVLPSKPTKFSSSTSLATSTSVPGLFLTGDNSMNGGSEAGDADDDDDLPHDWRPSPEVFAKMTSKEKRQLRNKISARNFRVRRKEYISTLEGDIAERDRMLDHFRTQLGSQESENLALRQEISALKKALLEGRGGSINLPPPAPLPEHSAAETLAASASSIPSSPLLTANTQKDLPTSPRIGNTRFWGGMGMGGGITPVHTTLVPDISTLVKKGLQENMNPALNAQVGLGGAGAGIGPAKGLGGFDGFADLNPFTMKTLDAYRMHLWGKMAAQQQMNQHSQTHHIYHPSPPGGLASNMRPHFFSPSAKPNLPPSASGGYGTTLSALLSGKQTGPSSSSALPSSLYPTPPASPVMNPKSLHSQNSLDMQQQREKDQQQQQHAMLAAMASQTVFRKLGTAFWDAFTGGTSSSSSTSTSPYSGNWDADKVQRVLEGKAVLRVVDLEPVPVVPAPASPKIRAIMPSQVRAMSSMPSSTTTPSSGAGCTITDERKRCKSVMFDVLEESMRSLSLGKKM